MGYGVKPLGYWNGKKFLNWRMKTGNIHPKLEDAFDIWQGKVGLTFTRAGLAESSVDFEVVSDGSISQWSPSKKTLYLKGSETLGALLHEIGHLLGMSHEHDRPDVRDKWYDANPGSFGKTESIRQAATRGDKLQIYGEVDLDSIMQYPENKYKAATEPSQGDIDAVKQINGWQ